MDTRLKEIRKAKGYKSAKAFAESIGMQEKTYRNYEQGVRNLYLDVACELCTALGCTLDELVGREKTALTLTPKETEVVDIMRSVTPQGVEQILVFSRGAASTYPKNNELSTTKIA